MPKRQPIVVSGEFPVSESVVGQFGFGGRPILAAAAFQAARAG